MKHLPLAALVLSLLSVSVPTQAQPADTIWFKQPAADWNSALPIGNGRLGAMVFGGVPEERIQFNEDTLWRGKPHDYVRAGAGEQLPKIRQLLAEGKIDETSKLIREKFLSDPIRQKPYQPFGDLRFHFVGLENPTEYRRELDLDTAVARVTYRVGEVKYRRETFVSFPDQAIIVHVSADQPGHISFTLNLDSPHTNSQTKATAANTLTLAGQVEPDGLRFESRARVIPVGGTMRTNKDSIVIDKADSVTVLLVAGTSFKTFEDISGNPAKRCESDLTRLRRPDFKSLLDAHVADHQKLYRRVNVDLGHSDRGDLATDERLKLAKTSGIDRDPALAALYFQYGRYLLIASSRPGTQPANLQGIWNELLNPPWESKWTLNINCEMNYWPAEVCNLSECHEPLFDMIDDLVVSGGRTAREQYGCRGWVVHHNTDLWRGTAPINNIDGVWPTGGPWLCEHLWEHYLFTGDKEFLAHRAYPAMKSASQFFEDFLIRDPKTGWLVTSPSFSPEQGTLTIGPTMDEQLIRSLMEHTIQAAGILAIDRKFASELQKVSAQLAPNQIGKNGQLQEWLDDVDVPNNNHRHMSPLWALYPGADITPFDGKIYDAAKVLLKWRGDGSTGWSFAWRIPLWARVGDGEFAYRQLNLLLQKRTLSNLFDLCGPFQIDGNFGAPAGIAEMLLQSHLKTRGERADVRILDILPALPKEWPNGFVTGLRARDGFELDIAWSNGELRYVFVRSRLGQPCVVRCGGRSILLTTEKGKEYRFDGELHATK